MPIPPRRRILWIGTVVGGCIAGCNLFLSEQKEPECESAAREGVIACPTDASLHDSGSEVLDGASEGSSQEAAASQRDPGEAGDARIGSYDASPAGDSSAHDRPALDASAGDASPHDGGAIDGAVATYKTSCDLMGTRGAACACRMPGPSSTTAPNSTACDATLDPAALCCADSAWPAAGSACSCMTASCNRPGGGGCSCSRGVGGDSCNDGTVCCVSPFSECLCTYGITECWQEYRRVDRCDGLVFGCGSGRKVQSCSIPR